MFNNPHILTPFIHLGDPQRWDAFVVGAANGHLMQASAWSRFKTQTSWQVQRVGLRQDGQIIAGAQLLFRHAPAKVPISMAYLSKGPVVAESVWHDPAQFEQVMTALWSLIHQTARTHHAIYLKIEPNFPDRPDLHQHLLAHGFLISPHTNHPHSTMLVDLRPDEADLLKRMRKKTRQLVRKAERTGVTISTAGAEALPKLYDILTTTAEIKQISSHEQTFYETAWHSYQNDPHSQPQLFLAQYEGETVAAKLIFTFGERSLHLWGGTSAHGRKLNASYLIQWEALRWAKHNGYTTSDLWGIPDEVGQLLKQNVEPPKDRQDALWGVYSFKRGFGGEVESYLGTYDYVYRPRLYRAVDWATQFSIDELASWWERIRPSRG